MSSNWKRGIIFMPSLDRHDLSTALKAISGQLQQHELFASKGDMKSFLQKDFESNQGMQNEYAQRLTQKPGYNKEMYFNDKTEDMHNELTNRLTNDKFITGIVDKIENGTKDNLGIDLTRDSITAEKNQPLRQALTLSIVSEFVGQQKPEMGFDYTMLFKEQGNNSKDNIKDQLMPGLDNVFSGLLKDDPKQFSKNDISGVSEKLSTVLAGNIFQNDGNTMAEDKGAMGALTAIFSQAMGKASPVPKADKGMPFEMPTLSQSDKGKGKSDENEAEESVSQKNDPTAISKEDLANCNILGINPKFAGSLPIPAFVNMGNQSGIVDFNGDNYGSQSALDEQNRYDAGKQDYMGIENENKNRLEDMVDIIDEAVGQGFESEPSQTASSTASNPFSTRMIPPWVKTK